MAVTDLQTGKIIGCKKGTTTWWHEKAHLLYNRSDKGIRNSFAQQSLFVITVVGLTIYMWHHHIYWKVVVTISMLGFIYYYIYEEIWCWVYAFKHLPPKSNTTK